MLTVRHPGAWRWWKCPGLRRNGVGNDSKFCWNCKTPLHPEDRADMAGGVWQHPASLLAQRFEVGDMYILLKKGLSVQQGTLALLLDGGAVKDVLKAGRHNLDSLGHRINHWGDPPPRSAVLINAGDTVLPLRVGSLRSAEEMEVEFYGEAVLRFVPGDAALFMNNLMKDQRELTFADLAERLQGDIRYALENMCNSSTIEDLVKDPQRRLRLEDELSVVLKRHPEVHRLCPGRALRRGILRESLRIAPSAGRGRGSETPRSGIQCAAARCAARRPHARYEGRG